MTETKSREKITVIDLPVTALRSFEEHPYKVVDNEEMASLVDRVHGENARYVPLASSLQGEVSSFRFHAEWLGAFHILRRFLLLRCELFCNPCF